MFVVVGNLVADVFVSGMKTLPDVGGDEYMTSNVAMFPRAPVLTIGGNCGNAAYVLATLGERVGVFGATGDDDFGRMLRGWLSGRGVAIENVKTSVASTSMTVVATDERLNRVAYHHAGANDDFSLDELPPVLLSHARVLLVTSYTICARMRDAAALRRTFETARAAGAVTALDIGPDISERLLLSEIALALPYLDYLLCNAHELSAFTGCDDVDAGIARVRAAGVACVVAKRGKAGARVGDASGLVDVPGIAVEARFTVGAGDSFDAGFLLAVSRNWTHVECARFGHAVAALVVSGSSGVLGAPSYDKVLEFIRRKL